MAARNVARVNEGLRRRVRNVKWHLSRCFWETVIILARRSLPLVDRRDVRDTSVVMGLILLLNFAALRVGRVWLPVILLLGRWRSVGWIRRVGRKRVTVVTLIIKDRRCSSFSIKASPRCASVELIMGTVSSGGRRRST
jgi:hypothetical protein